MFVEADRVVIRDILGASAIFTQAWPALEQAITQAQSVADGGTRPDDSTELLIRQLMASVVAIDQARAKLTQMMFVASADEAHIDPPRADAALCRQGRSLVSRLCATLSFVGPVRDRFSSSPVVPPWEFAPRVLSQ